MRFKQISLMPKVRSKALPSVQLPALHFPSLVPASPWWPNGCLTGALSLFSPLPSSRFLSSVLPQAELGLPPPIQCPLQVNPKFLAFDLRNLAIISPIKPHMSHLTLTKALTLSPGYGVDSLSSQGPLATE